MCNDACVGQLLVTVTKYLRELTWKEKRLAQSIGGSRPGHLAHHLGLWGGWQDKTTHLTSQGAKGKETRPQDPLSGPRHGPKGLTQEPQPPRAP